MDNIPLRSMMKGQLEIFTKLAAQQRAIIQVLRAQGFFNDEAFQGLVVAAESEVRHAYVELWKLVELLPD